MFLLILNTIASITTLSKNDASIGYISVYPCTFDWILNDVKINKLKYENTELCTTYNKLYKNFYSSILRGYKQYITICISDIHFVIDNTFTLKNMKLNKEIKIYLIDILKKPNNMYEIKMFTDDELNEDLEYIMQFGKEKLTNFRFSLELDKTASKNETYLKGLIYPSLENVFEKINLNETTINEKSKFSLISFIQSIGKTILHFLKETVIKNINIYENHSKNTCNNNINNDAKKSECFILQDDNFSNQPDKSLNSEIIMMDDIKYDNEVLSEIEPEAFKNKKIEPLPKIHKERVDTKINIFDDIKKINNSDLVFKPRLPSKNDSNSYKFVYHQSNENIINESHSQIRQRTAVAYDEIKRPSHAALYCFIILTAAASSYIMAYLVYKLYIYFLH
ncbi:hypothetical protein TCON_2127 [Astathelohania contejeani]|uniref:Uncharacterized protein n=1 Tax=Astathelohania contejeani TaxID=164912 RepID=A0ABQ7HWX5_9MICR|nr:hypothetical protein TCON_2127 [Thelohania contejeani]